jgi:hypothetical protein
MRISGTGCAEARFVAMDQIVLVGYEANMQFLFDLSQQVFEIGLLGNELSLFVLEKIYLCSL